jgi:hypothetical protein
MLILPLKTLVVDSFRLKILALCSFQIFGPNMQAVGRAVEGVLLHYTLFRYLDILLCK